MTPCPYCGGPVGPDLRAAAGVEISDAAVVVTGAVLDAYRESMAYWAADENDKRSRVVAASDSIKAALAKIRAAAALPAVSADPQAPPVQDAATLRARVITLARAAASTQPGTSEGVAWAALADWVEQS